MKNSLLFNRCALITVKLSLLLSLVFILQAKAQVFPPLDTYFQDDIDTTLFPSIGILKQTASSVNGAIHTPRGNLHILIIYVGFNDPNSHPDSYQTNLPGAQGTWLKDDIPNWAKGSSNWLFDNAPWITIAGIGKKNLSKYYYEMSQGQCQTAS